MRNEQEGGGIEASWVELAKPESCCGLALWIPGSVVFVCDERKRV